MGNNKTNNTLLAVARSKLITDFRGPVVAKLNLDKLIPLSIFSKDNCVNNPFLTMLHGNRTLPPGL